ncbi:MAG: DNA/RNA non-specific endonuclease [Planctomycetes bacterium]|nr:DNA/RNA non-specific endonuclease [Planctomycetota bacterium]
MDLDERAKRLKAMLTQVAKDGLESISLPQSQVGLEGGFEALEIDPTASALEKLKLGKSLTSDELFGLEAIVLPDKRPVVFIKANAYETVPMDDWKHLNAPEIHQRLEPLFPSIGRLELPLTPNIPYGGTGFVVGPNLMMTNRHVAKLFSDGVGTHVRFHAGGSLVDFRRENGMPEPDPGTLIRVTDVVMVHPFWDMALLRMEGLPATARPLPLSVTDPNGMVDQDVVVVGYPAQDFRNDADVQKRVFGTIFGVKRMQPGKIRGRAKVRSFESEVMAMTHDSSTLGGNSGSAVIDVKTGTIIGLHFAGVYLEANYAVPTFELARDSRVVDAALNFQGTVDGTSEWAAAWARTEGETMSQPVQNSVTLSKPAEDSGSVTWTIPLQVTVRLGTPTTAATTTGSVAPAAQEKVEIDTDYSKREGYNPNFLGGGKLSVPLPVLTTTQVKAAAINNEPGTGAPYELQYHHYSVVMNKQRRLAFFTAVNIDGTQEQNLGKREQDRWIFDHRVDKSLQIGNEWYGKPFDRGHLVRRLDPAWGRSVAIAKSANDDTFHFTNCSPQHSRFNQGKALWQGLENYLLDNANKNDRRITIFTGPIFGKDDPDFSGVQVPTRFWKVVAFVRDDGSLGSAGFLVSQEDLLAALESTAEDAAKTFQVRVSQIEKLTQLDFGTLRKFDSLDKDGLLEAVAGEEAPPAALTANEQIRL